MNTPRTRTTTLALGLALAFAAAPSVANADTYCVHGPCGAMAETYPHLDTAIFVAKFNPGVDRILIGQGTLTPTSVKIEQDNPVELIGSGVGSTRLVGDKNGGKPVIEVEDSATTISGLTLQMSGGKSGGGLNLKRGKASSIEVIDGPKEDPTTAGAGVLLSPGTSLRNSRVVMTDPGNKQLQAVAASAETDTPTLVEDTEISGFTALTTFGSGVVDARRLTIRNSGVGVGARGNGGTLRLSNSFIEATRVPGSVAISGGSFNADYHVNIEAWGVTAVGNGNDSVGARSFVSAPGVHSSVQLWSSTLSGFSRSLSRRGGAQAEAKLNVMASNYDPASVEEQGPGSVTGGSNLNVDPGFIDAATGDYRLRSDSPLVDAGNPYPFLGSAGPTDLAGAPRLVDGRGDGTSQADIGAFEYQPPVKPQASGVSQQGGGQVVAQQQQAARDTVAPAISGFGLSKSSVRRGSKSKVTARFALSEAATVRLSVERRSGRGRRARTVTVGSLSRSVTKGSNRVTLTAKLRPAGLKPGTYRLAITARDAAGNRSAVRRVSFRVTRKR